MRERDPGAVAAAFVAARREGRALSAYPGDVPSTLADGYRIQAQAIDLWGAPIAGWKVAALPADAAVIFGTDRLCGPLFADGVHRAAAPDVVVPIPAFGYVAFEPEYVVRVAADAPADKTVWSLDEAAAMIGSFHVGVEIAGSPLGSINELGPAASVSDFGTSIGLVLGSAIPDWDRQALHCAVIVNGRVVEMGGIYRIAGGPVAAVRFMLEHAARHGRPLHQDQLVSTGAAGGVHAVKVGDEVDVSFAPGGRLICRAAADGAASVQHDEAPAA